MKNCLLILLTLMGYKVSSSEGNIWVLALITDDHCILAAIDKTDNKCTYICEKEPTTSMILTEKLSLGSDLKLEKLSVIINVSPTSILFFETLSGRSVALLRQHEPIPVSSVKLGVGKIPKSPGSTEFMYAISEYIDDVSLLPRTLDELKNFDVDTLKALNASSKSGIGK